MEYHMACVTLTCSSLHSFDLAILLPFSSVRPILDGTFATRRVLDELPLPLLRAFLDILVPPDHSSSYLLQPHMSSSFFPQSLRIFFFSLPHPSSPPWIIPFLPLPISSQWPTVPSNSRRNTSPQVAAIQLSHSSKSLGSIHLPSTRPP